MTATYTKARDESPPDYTIQVIPQGPSAITLELASDGGTDDLSDGQQEIFDWLDRNPGCGFTTEEIIAGSGTPERTVERYLKELTARQLVVKQKQKTPKGAMVPYSVPEESDELGVIKNTP